jgi:hypothetical protein
MAVQAAHSHLRLQGKSCSGCRCSRHDPASSTSSSQSRLGSWAAPPPSRATVAGRGSGSRSLRPCRALHQHALLKSPGCCLLRRLPQGTVWPEGIASQAWSSALMASCWQQLVCQSR